MSDEMRSSLNEGGQTVVRLHIRHLLEQCTDLTRKVFHAENPLDTLVQDIIELGIRYKSLNHKSFLSVQELV